MGRGKPLPTLEPSSSQVRPLVATLNPTNVRFELRNLDLVQARDIYNI
jgi:hypothetical protein